jgi:hypothetical protein
MLLRKWQAVTAQWKATFVQARTYQLALALALGLLCGVGRRTITVALGFLGWEHQDWSARYRFFSRSPWEASQLFDPMLAGAVARYCPSDQPIPAAVDDTLLRRTGKHVPNACWQRDPMSPPFRINLAWGLRFLQVSLVLPLYGQEPDCSPRALPVRFAECPVVRKPGKQASPEQWAAYRQAKQEYSLSQQFVRFGQQLRQRLDTLGYSERQLLLTGDGSFCNRTTFRAHWQRTHLLCRARKDLRLCFRHQGAGTRYYGQEKFTPQQVYEDKGRQWQRARIFHGGAWRWVRYKHVKRVLWQGGAKRKELRLLVLAPTSYAKGPAGHRYRRQKAFLLTDDLQTSAQVLLQDYFDHFEIEFNHRDEKSLLGVGQAEVRSQKSVPRQPEFVVAAYSALLWASLEAYGPKRTQDYRPLPKWRRRPPRRPSCQDLVELLRQQIADAARKNPESGLPGVARMLECAKA